MPLSIYLSIYVPIYLSIYTSVCPSIDSSIYLPTSSIYIYIYIYIYVSTYLASNTIYSPIRLCLRGSYLFVQRDQGMDVESGLDSRSGPRGSRSGPRAPGPPG